MKNTKLYLLLLLPAGLILLAAGIRAVRLPQKLSEENSAETQEAGAIQDRPASQEAGAIRGRTASQEAGSLEIVKAPYGFQKKGGQYLLDCAEDIYQLAELVNSGQEVEEGIPAADASYRLLNDITLSHKLKTDFSGIGTEEHPFHGVIDGDGHTLAGNFFADCEEEYRYVMACGDGVAVNLRVDNLFKERCGWHKGREPENDYFPKLLEAPFTVDMSSGYGQLYAIISDQAECDGLVNFLKHEFQTGSLYLTVGGASIDTAELAQYIFGCQNYEIKVDWAADTQASAEGFLSHLYEFKTPAGILAVVEGEPLAGFHKQWVKGLACASFFFQGWDEFGIEAPPVLVAVWGEWAEGQKVCQLIPVSAPEYMMQERYHMEALDVNFDGWKDLMICMGTSGGSGGSWTNYRSAVWDPAKKEFAFFPSMPEQITFFDRAGKRIIHSSRCGAGDETVIAYEIIEGEYRETRRLELVSWEEPSILYYFENGELTEEIPVSGDEVTDLFPDMDYWYWPRG